MTTLTDAGRFGVCCFPALSAGGLIKAKTANQLPPSIIGTTRMTSTAPAITAKSFAQDGCGQNKTIISLTTNEAL